MNAVKFKNFSDEDFTWKYDGVSYTFPAQSEMFLEDFKAVHFAKHLIDREINKKNVTLNLHKTPGELTTSSPHERSLLEKLCFPSSEVITPQEAINIEETKKELETKKKAGRPKKVAEEEFEDLKK